MALTNIGKVGITGISNSADATFLTATSSEGVTFAGTLAVTGVHTIGNNAIYTSDGGAVTQNAVQSFTKGWVHASSNASLNDSHNIASGTDNGTGDYTYAHTNNYNNATYANAGNVQTDARRCQYVRSIATSSLRVRHWNEDGGYNDVINAVQMTGDLA